MPEEDSKHSSDHEVTTVPDYIQLLKKWGLFNPVAMENLLTATKIRK